VCGLTGFLDRRGTMPADGMVDRARSMAARIAHRGPDDSGEWVDPASGIALAFRRLSIVDLSPLGHQPMHSQSGRWVIAFNGEVYNFLALRAELEGAGVRFRSHSDTEVMLAAFEAWGVREATTRFNGMFAFALWDRQTRALWLGRDRMGKKPLYYGFARDGALVFGSELKALAAYPGLERNISRDALALYLQYGYVPGPYSIFEGIYKAPPASLLRFDDGVAEPESIRYWSMLDVVQQGASDPFPGGDDEALSRIDDLIRESCRLRMIADVPLGAFLSGGIDSSLVVAAMQAQSSTAVRTFTIGFDEPAYNEATYAAAVARHLGTDHTELYVSAVEARAVIPRLPAIYDEPFGDASQIPTFLVSALARQHVTVALSGDGGDELFGGYNRHVWAAGRSARLMTLPRPIRKAAAATLRAVPKSAWESIYAVARPLLPSSLRASAPGEKAHKFAYALGSDSARQAYFDLVTLWPDALQLVRGALALKTAVNTTDVHLPSLSGEMMFFDAVSYLPDDILVKVDRAAMAVSLEPRAPLLDMSVVAFAATLPLRMKIRNGRGKWILRRVLERYVPPVLFERPKTGFGIPIDEWLRGPLREWAEEFLSERRLDGEGFFDARAIRAAWSEHLAGRGNWQQPLWAMLMFEAWLSATASPGESSCSDVVALSGAHPSLAS
jgi:asparagine synthase (glutamine-hydrolysing)